MMATRVLLQTVGTGGPEHPVWEAMARVVRERRPDVLVQLCSRKTFDETIPRFEAALGAGDRPNAIRREVCHDEENVERLTLEYCGVIDRVREAQPGAVIEADYTSGTKAMSAALVAASIARRASELLYATGRRDETGRVTRTERILPMPTDQLIAEPISMELGRLFDLGQFVAVERQASVQIGYARDPALQARFQTLAVMSNAYESWDRFAWKDAFSSLRRLDEKAARGSGWDMDLIKLQCTKHLCQCRKQDPPGPERLVDLLANADRCVTRGRYDDATSRLYRLSEYILQVRMFAKHEDIKSLKRFPWNFIQHLAPQHSQSMAQRVITAADGRQAIKPGLHDLILLLHESGDPVAKLMNDEEFFRQRDRRNESFLAHGEKVVKQSDAVAFRESCGRFLNEHLTDLGLELGSMCEVARFAQCPWAGDPSRQQFEGPQEEKIQS